MASSPDTLASILISGLQGPEKTFLHLIGVEVSELQQGSATLRLVVREDHCRPGRILHGGVTATLLDSACGLSGATLLSVGQDLVTAQLNINYIRTAAPGQTLFARGHVEHRGKRTLICRAEVRSEDGQLMGIATATMMVLDGAAGKA
jgi:uncharacterized protein (TIGR00369 family)